MIRQTLPFADGAIQAMLPDRTRVVSGNQWPAAIVPLSDEDSAVREALSRPLGMPRIARLVRPSSRVLIAFDDPTVPSEGPIRRLAIEAVLDELSAAGVAEGQVTLICANAPMTIGLAKATARELGKPDAILDLDRLATMATACFDSADYTEGRTAFMEKRKPQFKGK